MVSLPQLRRLGLVLLLGVIGGMLIASPVSADTPGPSAGPSPTAPAGPTVAECLSSGDVWLVIETDTQVVLRSECVGRPATGQDALRAAEVATTNAKGGYLCTLAGYPARCPHTYRGQFWQYWHAGGGGAPWEFSTKGAGDYSPRPGSIEGWCYNAAGSDRCRPALPALTDGPSPRVDPPPAVGPDIDVTVWLAAGVLGITGVIFWIVRHRTGGQRQRRS